MPLRYLLGLCILLTSFYAHALDPFLDWQTLESDHFKVHFAAGDEQQAQRVSRIAETVHQELSRWLDWQPAAKTHLVLSDETDFANGFATVININRSVLYAMPPTGVGGLEDFDDWLYLLIAHEYTHVLHLDRVESPASALRHVFGRQLLSFPNLLEPLWLIEGIATYVETDHERGTGRGQSSLYRSMMRAEMAAGLKPLQQVNLPINTWPAGATRYLYGVYFFEFLHATYGEDSITQLVAAYSSNLLPFSVNSTFERLFGKDAYALWDEFGDWLAQVLMTELAAIEAAGVVEGEAVNAAAYRTTMVRSRNDKLYFVRNTGDSAEALVVIDNDELHELVEVRGAGFDVSADEDIIISQLEVCNEYNIYRDLYLYRSSDDSLQRLTECGRYVRAVWSPDAAQIYAVRHVGGRFVLELLDRQGRLVEPLHDFSEGTVAGWIDVAPDNSALVAALWQADYGWNLHRFDLASRRWSAITRDNVIQSYPSYTTDADCIVYSADYDGTHDIYRYCFTAARHQRLTRTLTGALQPELDGADLYFTATTAQGSGIRKLEAVAALGDITPPAGKRIRPYDLLAVDAQQSDYRATDSLELNWWFPAVGLSEDVTEVGFTTTANDALGIHNIFARLTWDTSNSVPAGDLVYSFSNRFAVALSRDNTLLRNSSGDLTRVRGQQALRFNTVWPSTGLRRSTRVIASLGWETSFDVSIANGALPAADFSDNSLGLAWQWDNTERYPLSISQSDGRQLSLVVEDGGILDSDLDGRVTTASWKEYIGTGGESVLALQALLGWGEGRTSLFVLGGEDTGVNIDLLLQQSTAGLFDRRDYPLRGYAQGLPQLVGQRAALLSAEWRFPGQRVERGWMAPPVGLMQWAGNVFLESGSAFDGSSPKNWYPAAGAELTADLNLFYLVPVRARLGLARGLDDSIGDTRLYLSLGSSF